MSEFRPGRFQVLPLVIKYLLIINVVVWLAQVALQSMYGFSLSDFLGLRYWGSEHFRPHQFITHLFLHDESNFLHVFSNMFALWMFGSTLENRWGPKRFLNFYLICGLGAAFCHEAVLTYENMQLTNLAQQFYDQPTLDNFRVIVSKYNLDQMQSYVEAWSQLPPDSDQMVWQARHFVSVFVEQYRNVPTVGASGAVFGVLLAFGYLYPNQYLFIIPIPFPIKVKYFIGGYILWELYVGFKNQAGDNVAHFAHLGGALFAYILLKIWRERSSPRSY
ncbi:rhomboid family intramembrane serine protease [Chitinophaga sp.]|uniref:rhomboid family intramembrane serine protease n=1 Tax=Chitinophaga sp. TaxID=1869181 RepID=UPI002639AD53|nr:rhomboid family intramembrane serine protease [uncultured Chitinophaga sp.]